MKHLSSRVGAPIIAFALGITLAGGVSAVATSTSRAVKACATQHHFLVIARGGVCPGGSHAISISQRGPRGVQGKPGSPGKDGTNGYSVAYVGANQASSDSPVLTESGTTVNRIKDLPAGLYVATYNALIDDTGPGTADVDCHVTRSDETGVAFFPVSWTHAPSGQLAQITGNGLVHTSDDGLQLDLFCGAIGNDAYIYDSSLTLIPVNTSIQSP